MTIQTPMKSRLELIGRYLDAFDRQDWETVKACLASDSVHIEPGGMELHGPEATAEGIKVFKTAMPDLTHTLIRVIEGPDGAVAELVWHGTHTGPLPTPRGTIEASGRAIQLSACKVFAFEGDQIKYGRHYWDQMELLAAIGAVPTGG